MTKDSQDKAADELKVGDLKNVTGGLSPTLSFDHDDKRMHVPLLTLLPVPSLLIDDVQVNFEMEVNEKDKND